VDDEANTLASLSRAFRLAGHEAVVCDNAAKALDLAKAQTFDLILSDVVMPGKDGLSLLEDLKAQGVTSPVVMIRARRASRWPCAQPDWEPGFMRADLDRGALLD
jgi:DNA-binding response OmpR family regulator